MNKHSGNASTRRNSSIGGSLAAIVTAVALAFGTGSVACAADVHGVVAAERYRAPQASTQDIQLGNTAVAELLQNDAFLKAIKDTDVQRLVVDPGFVTASKLLLDHPETARQILAGRYAGRSDEAMRLVSVHASAARLLLARPEAARAMYRYPEATQRFVSAQIRTEADRRTVADRLSDRQVAETTADRMKANPKNHPQADDTTADRMKANPRNNPQADDMSADRMKANPSNNRQANDTTADRMKANPKY